jgi:hypothetical protein
MKELIIMNGGGKSKVNNSSGIAKKQFEDNKKKEYKQIKDLILAPKKGDELLITNIKGQQGKNQNLKPLQEITNRVEKVKGKEDPHKRLIDQLQIQKKENETHTSNFSQRSDINTINTNNQNNKSATSFNKFDKTLLDDKDFRKTQIKKEKVKIEVKDVLNTTDYSRNESILSRSLINFNKEEDEWLYTHQKETENIFNNLVRSQMVNEYAEVHSFLEEIDLTKYIDEFIKKGYDKMDKVITSKF